jgi:hypothetical protein
MAKSNNTLTVIEELKNNIAVLDPSVLSELEGDAGRGLSKKIEDNVLPLVKFLQSNSPECAKRTPTYVEGAEAGDFLFKNREVPVVKGETGFLFQPLARQRAYVQWKPNRGGYAGQHADIPPEAKERIDINPEDGKERRVLGLPNGDYLEETVYFYGWLEDRSLWVLPFRSTGLLVARNWMTGLNNTKLQVNDPAGVKYLELPIWGSIWRVCTEVASNAEHTWFVPKPVRVSKFGDPGFGIQAYHEAKKAALELIDQLESGEKVVEAMALDDTPARSNTGAASNRPASRGAPQSLGDTDIPF